MPLRCQCGLAAFEVQGTYDALTTVMDPKTASCLVAFFPIQSMSDAKTSVGVNRDCKLEQLLSTISRNNFGSAIMNTRPPYGSLS